MNIDTTKLKSALAENYLILIGVLVFLIIIGFSAYQAINQSGSGASISDEAADAASSQQYIVKDGDHLWKIAEEVFGSGYNAYDIAKANNLEEPYYLATGQVLVIPSVEPKTPTVGDIMATSTENSSEQEPMRQSTETTMESSPAAMEKETEESIAETEKKKSDPTAKAQEPTSTIAPTETPKPTATIAPTATPEPTKAAIEEKKVSSQKKYTIKRGDTLWTIAEEVYGSGFEWVTIAKANKLSNPNLIHADNELVIPAN